MPRFYRSFRVKPHPDRPEYYKVFVFRDRETMHRFWEEQLKLGTRPRQAQEGDSRNYLAQASWFGWNVFKQKAKRHQVGQVIFHIQRCGAEIVAHEMTHVALYWMQARGLKLDNWKARIFKKNDELLAGAVGSLCVQFYTNFWGLFPRARFR